MRYKVEIINEIETRQNRREILVALKKDGQILITEKIGVNRHQLEGDNDDRLQRYGERMIQKLQWVDPVNENTGNAISIEK